MSEFTPQELSTIALFFGVPANTQPGNALSDFYFLEPGSVDHPIGDSLEVIPNGFIVTFEDTEAPAAQHPWYFSRDFAGLVAALEKLTTPIA